MGQNGSFQHLIAVYLISKLNELAPKWIKRQQGFKNFTLSKTTRGVYLDMCKWFLTCDAELQEETYDSMASFLLFETWQLYEGNKKSDGNY